MSDLCCTKRAIAAKTFTCTVACLSVCDCSVLFGALMSITACAWLLALVVHTLLY
jgi:hypothetical protein